MTPKQQARKLVRKFYPYAHGLVGTEQLEKNAKKCAEIYCDGMIKFAKKNNLVEKKFDWEQIKGEVGEL